MGTSIVNADFTNVANWQGVELNPNPGSKNIVESGGVYYSDFQNFNGDAPEILFPFIGMVYSGGKLTAFNNGSGIRVVPVRYGTVLKLKAQNKTATYLIVKDFVNALNAPIDYATGESEFHYVSANKEATITITQSDAKYVVFRADSPEVTTGASRFPQKLTINQKDFANNILYGNSNVKDTLDSLSQNTTTLSGEIDDEITRAKFTDSTLDNVCYNYGIFGDGLTWLNLTEQYVHIVIDIQTLNASVLRYSTTKVSRFAFVKSYKKPVVGEELDYVSQEGSYVAISSGTFAVDIPSGTNYIVLLTKFQNNDCTPEYFNIGGIDFTKSIRWNVAKTSNEKDDLKANELLLNLISDFNIQTIQGKYLSTNLIKENADTNSFISDYIQVEPNVDFYYTGRSGGTIAGAKFYSDYNTAIGYWPITESHQQYNNQLVPIMSGAKYVKFSSFSSSLSVSAINHQRGAIINNTQANRIFNQLSLEGVDIANGVFNITIFKAFHNTINNVYSNGVYIGYRLNNENVDSVFLTKNYATADEASANLAYLSTYSQKTSKGNLFAYNLNWDAVDAERIIFTDLKLNPNSVKSNTVFGDDISKGTRNIKSILWLGTSIPAGGYPGMVGSILGCKVYNEAEGESLCRLGWGSGCIQEGDTIDIWGCDINTHLANPMSNTITTLAKSLSASIAEKQYLIDNLAHFEEVTQTTLDRTRYTDDVIMSFSYENKILKYVDSSRNDYTPVDLIVFDHGHNDLNPDGDPAWNTYSLYNTDKNNYFGAMNFLLDTIKKYQPNIAICQVSHYYGWENYTGSAPVQKIWEAQKQIADYNGMVFCPLYKLSGYSSQRMLRTCGYWSHSGVWYDNGFSYVINGDNTITTNSRTIAGKYRGNWNGEIFTSTEPNNPDIVSQRDISRHQDEDCLHYLMHAVEAAFPDALHPVSDVSTKALKKIATILAGWIGETYCMY